MQKIPLPHVYSSQPFLLPRIQDWLPRPLLCPTYPLSPSDECICGSRWRPLRPCFRLCLLRAQETAAVSGRMQDKKWALRLSEYDRSDNQMEVLLLIPLASSIFTQRLLQHKQLVHIHGSRTISTNETRVNKSIHSYYTPSGSGGFRAGPGGPWRGGEMVSAQYLRGARRGGGNLLAGRPKILGEGGNENLYPPLPSGVDTLEPRWQHVSANRGSVTIDCAR